MNEMTATPELTGFGGRDNALYVGFARRTRGGWHVSRAGNGGAGRVYPSEKVARQRLADWGATFIEDSREEEDEAKCCCGKHAAGVVCGKDEEAAA